MMRRAFRPRLLVTALGLAGAIALATPGARGADHLDGPRLMTNPVLLGNLDINDVYIFQGANPKNTVLVMTLSPAAGLLGPAQFSPIAAYEFQIENTGDANTDIIFHFNFSFPNSTGHQTFQYYMLVLGNNTVPLAGTGTTGQTNVIPITGGMVRPDLFDDPFFFDLLAFNKFKAQAMAGNPNAAAVFNQRGVSNIPNNFFGGFNVMAIVMEVPSILLQSSPSNTKIGVWARTLVPSNAAQPQNQDTQFDRMGRPAINTVLIDDSDKDLFNTAVPAIDSAFIPIASAHLTELFGNPTTAAAHARALLPDIMTFDTSSSAGFLNGRQLEDDVIDAELNLLSNGVVTTDSVVNDSVFFTGFPYLGTPNPKTAIAPTVKPTTPTSTPTTPVIPKLPRRLIR